MSSLFVVICMKLQYYQREHLLNILDKKKIIRLWKLKSQDFQEKEQL